MIFNRSKIYHLHFHGHILRHFLRHVFRPTAATCSVVLRKGACQYGLLKTILALPQQLPHLLVFLLRR